MGAYVWAPLLLFSFQLASTNLVSTGEEFVSAVTEFGREGGQVELQLDTASAISVANVTWDVIWSVEAQPQSFPQGNLLITAAPSEDGRPAVLDAAMKSGLAPGDTEQTVTWRNIVFINLCSVALNYNPSVDYKDLFAIEMFLMPRGQLEPRVQRRDSIVYTTYREFSGLVYWMTLDTSPFPDLQKWIRKVFQVDWKSNVDVAHLGVFSMTVKFWNVAGGEDFNVTFRATNNRHDPLGFMLPEFGGSLMHHRLCVADGNSSGQPLPEDMVNPSVSFLWMVNGSAQLQDALRNISESELTDERFGDEEPVAIATILDDVSVADGGGVLEGVRLRLDVLLNGPLSSRCPILDFADREGVLTMESSDMTIYIRNLELKGLKSTAILNEDGTSSSQSTSLQLAAIVRRDRQLLQMHGVTLEVAKSDFLCLLSAAHRGAQWKSGASTNAHLLEPISVFKPKAYNNSTIEFEEYSGWGIEGKDIQFVSATPVLPLESPLLTVPKSHEDEGKDETALGVGIGVGVGGGLLLIFLLLGLAVVRKRRISRKGTCSHSMEDVEAQTPSTATEQEEEERQMGSNMKFCVMEIEQEIKDCRLSKAESVAVDVAEDQSTTSSSQLGSRPSKAAEGVRMVRGTGVQKAEQQARGSGSACQGPPASGGAIAEPVEIEVDGHSMPLQKIMADQGGEEQGSFRGPQQDASPHELVQKKVASLYNVSSDDVLRLQNVIGKGAWGTVYKGTWKGLTVAVKTVLFTGHYDNQNQPQKARAVLEAAVSTSLSHPNIVSTYHYDIRPVSHDDGAVQSGLQVQGMTGVVDDWKLYLVLEYCHFTLGYATNSDLLHRGGKPLVDKILLLLLDVAKGMLYLHDHMIIHGDLKPENVLLKVDSESPSGLVAKITDFGLAINLGPTATHVSNITTGTPFYCAPEVPLNGRATKASDVFSFGVVMAEICSKTPPWIKVKGEFLVNPRFPNFGPDMPRAFGSLAMRCLQPDLTKRPKFEEIISDLQGLHKTHKIQELFQQGSPTEYSCPKSN